jgi:ribosomal protein L7/L12
MDEPETLARIAALEHKVSRLYQHLGIMESALGPEAEVSPEVQQALAAGNLIGAIKIHREQTGRGLAEAKQEVESWWARNAGTS